MEWAPVQPWRLAFVSTVLRLLFVIPLSFTVLAEWDSLCSCTAFYIQPCVRAMYETWFAFLFWWHIHVYPENNVIECQLSPQCTTWNDFTWYMDEQFFPFFNFFNFSSWIDSLILIPLPTPPCNHKFVLYRQKSVSWFASQYFFPFVHLFCFLDSFRLA